MAESKEVVQKSDFKDRKVGLVVFGILEILMGGFCVLMVPFMLLGMILSTTVEQSTAAAVSVQMMIPGILLYASLAVWFIWMGIGSIKARRWARALVLVSSWIWLIVGVVAIVFWFVFMSDMYGQMAQSGQMPPEMVNIVKLVTTIFLFGIYVIIPGILVLFYGSKHVKATCKFRDSQVRWTDKCPLPVLALSLLLASGAFSMMLTPFYNSIVPFFGVLLSGIRGAVVVLVVILLFGYLAWGTYKLKMTAWWGTVVLTIVGAVSSIMTFSHVSLWELYEKMNFPAQQIEVMRQSGILENFNMVWYIVFWAAAFLGYLLYTRRFFTTSSAQGED